MSSECELFRCAVGATPPEDGAELPYGLRADGTLAHVSEVPAGLACACTCPSCDAALVARKGRVLAHHFAHYVDRGCAGAWETTLHILAKEVIAASRSILLPEALAVLGQASERVAGSMTFRYDAVDLEVHMSSIRPDAVIRGRGRDLAVEVAVTHASDTAKIDALRQRGLAAIEIDLSRVPRHASRDEHTDLVLRSAPRRWLHNTRIEDTISRLRVNEARRREELRDETAAGVAAAWHAPSTSGHPRWRQLAQDAGFGDDVGLQILGSRCFSVDAATWQAAVLDFAVMRLLGQVFSADDALQVLQGACMAKGIFAVRRRWDADLVAALRAEVPGFVPPEEAVVAYAEALVGRGVLTRAPGGRWQSDLHRAHQAKERLRNATMARDRARRLKDAVTHMLAGVPRAGQLDLAAWLARPLSPGGPTPSAIAAEGGKRYGELLRRIADLGAAIRDPHSPAMAGLMGLSLEEVHDHIAGSVELEFPHFTLHGRGCP
jgi:hypothetical protein